MTTGKKPPATEEERKQRAREKARLRKQRFDEKLRNPDGGGRAGRRRGSVLYLSDAARDVLTRNRQRRHDARFPQVLDANLIESLLLAYADQGEPEHPEGPLVIDETKAHPGIANLLRIKADLERKLAIQPQFRPIDWDAIEFSLLAAHRLIGSQWSRDLAKRIYRDALSVANEGSSAGTLDREMLDHIKALIYWASRFG